MTNPKDLKIPHYCQVYKLTKTTVHQIQAYYDFTVRRNIEGLNNMRRQCGHVFSFSTQPDEYRFVIYVSQCQKTVAVRSYCRSLV